MSQSQSSIGQSFKLEPENKIGNTDELKPFSNKKTKIKVSKDIPEIIDLAQIFDYSENENKNVKLEVQFDDPGIIDIFENKKDVRDEAQCTEANLNKTLSTLDRTFTALILIP